MDDSVSARFVEKCSIHAHTRNISSVKFAPKNPLLLASSSADSSVKVWNVTHTEAAQRVLEGHTQGVSDIAWSPTGAWIASASDDHSVRLWDSETGDNLAILGDTKNRKYGQHNPQKSIEVVGHTNYVYSVAFNPQGSLLASASFDETVRLWDLRTHACVAVIDAHQEAITCVAFSHDGTLLSTSSYDGVARVWDVSTQQCLRTLILEPPPAPPRTTVSYVNFSPNSRYILCSMLDQRLRLWDYMQGSDTIVKEYSGHVNKNLCISSAWFRFREKLCIVSGSEDNTVIVWDAIGQQVEQVLHGHDDAVITVSTSDSCIASAAGQHIKIWTST
uniref:Uncharacterized protein AlNc14C10G1224 n=1 Tax=Albugo laibachii Nc14 TaxID=890382 RepID=F0W2H3_9STRA|nr:unknown putative [Albugo laibachii Nc14]|eukprot:CCA15259.1 unknown putative [Albugo laibachii Nc14]